MRSKLFRLAMKVDGFFHKVDKSLHERAKRYFPEEYSEIKSARELEVLPRVFEYSFAIKNLPKKGKVLEVGCTASANALPVTLAELGYEVYGVDLRPFKVGCNDFQFVICDARYLPFRAVFECCYSISTIEHVGLPSEWSPNADWDGDKKAIREMINAIKPHGSLVITVPFGKKGMLPDSRIYDTEDVKRLFAGLTIAEEDYIIESQRGWSKTSLEEAAKATHKPGFRAVAMFKLIKEENNLLSS
jgi:SAM-dependent methyltransferase